MCNTDGEREVGDADEDEEGREGRGGWSYIFSCILYVRVLSVRIHLRV